MLVPSWLLRAADRRPDHPALTTDEGDLSYRALVSAVDAEAGRLWRAGARCGDHVVLTLPPGRSFVVALHAVLRLGAIAVPLDPALPAEERERRGAAATVEIVAAETPPAEPFAVRPPGPGEPRTGAGGAKGLSEQGDAFVVRPLGADRSRSSDEGAAPELLDDHDLDAPAIVVHTSGTSGPARPIPLTYGNWLWSAIGSAATLGCPPGERWLCAMPLNHVGGLSVLLRSVIAGTTAVVHAGWDTERVLAALTGDEPPTMVSLVPTTLRRLLDAGLRGPAATGGTTGTSSRVDDGREGRVHRLRWVLLGGAAIPAGLLDDAAAADVPVAPTYGMSEATSQIATLGPPLFCTTVRIDDPRGDGRDVASADGDADGHAHAHAHAGDAGDAGGAGDAGDAGEGTADRERGPRPVHPTTDPDVVGEILVRGPTVAAVAAGPDGWLRTGDLGRLDARGHLAVVGRTSDTIISGGENVLPLEVERVLDRLDGVRESAVFGRPDPEWGERVAARLIVDDPASFDIEALRATIRPLLAPHQRPREIELVDALPRTPSGKLLRRALR